ncbi:tRNA (adenosine(37)-N6)-threonylcarbamoyltransferase complex ATPase subunit type 1 TsaE [Crocinitomicaceae bacterium]|nr:tRNA (adenosine(37)-N6)-threonylcarbamoyltransferase complex ATPase subunit type 1 TsaE [Crocinitomicaceae bacterium]
MYEAFYNFSEKPFTLLPDPGFLFLSDKHRMALTLLEYGLENQAGFTVISGDIGAGKTTLIRHLLNNMDREHTVGLISNTHRSFGELLQWILLAFNLEHRDMDKVEMYQRFVDFIIDEYAHNRRVVLIVDEAQNMDAETLEELRMLSNVNADKDQALQVVLVGQRELRETLQRPDLVQFAQRIAVDYHLRPLSDTETIGYIRHRMEVAGGNPDTFTDAACIAVHRYSSGVPRLINLLCDTALVYGYAEQKQHIDAQLVTEVAREKQEGGIFPTSVPAEFDEDLAALDAAALAEAEARASSEPQSVEAAPELQAEPAASDAVEPSPAQPVQPVAEPATTDTAANDTVEIWEQGRTKKKLRLAVYSVNANSQKYLSRLLESYGFDVAMTAPLEAEYIASLDPADIDVLVIDREETGTPMSPFLDAVLQSWNGPLLYSDAQATETSLQQGDPEFGRQLAEQIHALAETTTEPVGAVS